MNCNELCNIFGDFLNRIGNEVLLIQQSIIYVENKNDGSPYTKADLYCSAEIGKKLKEEFEKIPIIDEENNTRASNEDYYFLVDPLDGSKEFIKKNKDFTINIALMKNAKPLWGVVYAPAYDELYIGGKTIGFKSFCFKKEKVFENSERDGKNIKMVGSVSHSHPSEIQLTENLKKSGYSVDFVNFGSSLKICKLAEGSVDFYPRFNPTMEWDTAAAQAVLEGAGGKIFFLEKDCELYYKKDGLINSGFLAFSKMALSQKLNEVVRAL